MRIRSYLHLIGCLLIKERNKALRKNGSSYYRNSERRPHFLYPKERGKDTPRNIPQNWSLKKRHLLTEVSHFQFSVLHLTKGSWNPSSQKRSPTFLTNQHVKWNYNISK